MTDYLSDWTVYFMPAVMAWLSGGNPYAIKGFYSPPWMLPVLALFAYLPRLCLPVLSTIGFLLVGLKHRLSIWRLLLFLTSAPVVFCIFYGNFDWIVMLGLYSLKPQLGLVPLLKRPKRWSVVLVLALTFSRLLAPWGTALVSASGEANASLWPYSVPFTVLLWHSAPMVASLCLSSHVSFSSYSALSLWLAKRRPLVLYGLSVATWWFIFNY